jgi:hypothetical protein
MHQRVMAAFKGVGLAVGLAAAASSFAACSSNDDAKSGMDSAAPDSGTWGKLSFDAGSLPESLAQLVNAECGLSAACCAKAGQPTPHESACRTTVIQGLASVQPFLDQGQAVLDEAKVRRCVALLASIQSSCDPAPYAGMSGACENLFAGTVPEKGRCEGGNTCAHGAGAGAICLRNLNSDAGVDVGICAPLIYGKEGDDCLLTLDDGSGGSVSADFSGDPGDIVACRRDDGLKCDSSTHTCTKLAGKDGACVSDECSSDFECVAQKCVARMGLGEACSPDAPCRKEWACDNGKCTFSLTDAANCGI